VLPADLGAACLLAALCLAGFGSAVAFRAGRRDDEVLAQVGRHAFYASVVLVAGASVTLLAAMAGNDFRLAYVTEHSDRALSLPLKLAGFYGGQEGSLLYWALVLGILGSAAVAAAARADVRQAAYAQGFLAAIAGFFLLLLVFVASPFAVLTVTPADGLGLNPVLRDGGMLIHPPFQLAGYSSFAVPFSFAMASLLAGRDDASWIARTRQVALVSWGLQSAGLVLGMWWAYHVLGWGGYFGWDPVENVALMPWLAVTAYLHSIQVQRRRGRLRAWNMGLVILAFLLSIFGTFIVRSGILPSVHTFAVSPLGPWFFGFLAVCLLVSGILLASRSSSLRSDQPLDDAVSREGAFLLQNVLIVLLIAAILWGTLLPLLTQVVGAQMVVGPAYYERVAAPLLALLLALLAAGPLLAWRPAPTWWGRLRWPVAGALLTLALLLTLGLRQPGGLIALPLAAAGLATCLREYVRGARAAGRIPGSRLAAAARLAVRNRRRSGAYLAHVGILAVAIGIAGSHFWQQQVSTVLQPGQTLAVSGYRLTYEGISQHPEGDHSAQVARLRLGDGAVLEPARLLYAGQGGQAVSRIVIRTTPVEDLYIVLAGPAGRGGAAFTVFVNPLVPWIWAGGALLVFGLLVGNLELPRRRQPRRARTARAATTVTAP
jgi:cytochrome c-type biogenesis protein CcmF